MIEMNTMIETLFGSKLRAKVIGWLFSHPDERYFVRQISNLLGEDSTNVSRELARLEESGILISTTEGKQRYYQVNNKHPVFNELKSIVTKTFGVTDVIRKSLETEADKIKVAFIFGSIARNTDDRASDIDVMIIGEINFADVVSLLTPAEELLHREINAVVYSIAEYKKRIMEQHYFVIEVTTGEKIFLVGDDDELRRLAGR